MKLYLAYANSSDAPLVVGVFSSAAKAITALEDMQGKATVEAWQVAEVELDHLLGDN